MAETQTTQFSPVQEAFIPNIKIIGVGGAGGNVVTQMAEENFDQVETIICNTDLKALKRNKSHKKIELGKKLTRGMGAGARPEVGEGAAEESLAEINEAIDDWPWNNFLCTWEPLGNIDIQYVDIVDVVAIVVIDL